jgi:creatinine amidohydrolase/Fe(II)-dependent formamide hydrolase-like protein/GNAT superfamily N-acetyltransferase
MIDGHDTTLDWQSHPTDILVLPIGAFEQHSVHLPLDTDSIQADYFGRMIAEDLDAALLPAIHIATSMEHTGHRGSFSLRPETLMHVVRDIADEAIRQHFRILILANAHGGNHCLVPVCRDINRRDGALKILLVNFWEHRDPSIQDSPGDGGMNFHANESETSILLHIHPELVRKERADAAYSPRQRELVQSDLTTFGVGNINPSGAIGWPSLATPAKGKAFVDSVRIHMLAHLRNRIARLRASWHYAGPAGLAIRPLLPTDLAACMRLKSIAHWNQTDADWTTLLDAAPGGSFAMVHQGSVIGTITTTPYGNVAWIGMLLVDPAFRGMGVGTRLMEQAIAHLLATPCLKLDATDAGRPVYLKLGFTDECRILRLTCAMVPPPPASPDALTRAMTDSDLAAVSVFDQPRFGADRGVILRALRSAGPAGAHLIERGGRIAGYVLGRRGSDFAQVGPLMADTLADARALLQAALIPLAGRPATLDVPAAQTGLIADLRALGFVEQRAFTRMARGAACPGQPSAMFAIGGPELG